MNKLDIRKSLRLKRKSINLDIRNETSILIAKTIYKSDIYKRSNNIALYHPSRFEINPLLIFEVGQTFSKSFCLPILNIKTNKLIFLNYKTNDSINLNRYNIFEPAFDLNKIIDPTKLDLAIVPLVGFDKNGHRLGQGAGYYDRTFFSLEKRPFLLGVGFSFQQVEELPSDEWDIPLDGIVTEKGLQIFNKDPHSN